MLVMLGCDSTDSFVAFVRGKAILINGSQFLPSKELQLINALRGLRTKMLVQLSLDSSGKLSCSSPH